MNNNKSQNKFGVMGLISLFFLIFGMGLFVAVFYSDTFQGKIVNIICGLFFMIATIVSHWLAKMEKK